MNDDIPNLFILSFFSWLSFIFPFLTEKTSLIVLYIRYINKRKDMIFNTNCILRAVINCISIQDIRGCLRICKEEGRGYTSPL